MRVMGVDPGLTRCGLSVVESGRGRQLVALDVDVVLIERVFSQQNVASVMGTAQAGGIVALAAGKHGIDVHFHTPTEVKAAVTGNGAADKAQVTAMVTRILALQAKPTP